MTQLTTNPYAPPECADQGMPPQKLENGEIWREGRYVVCPRDAHLPDRCVRCNKPAEDYSLLRKLSWHHGAWFLLILLNLLIYLIVALCIRKTAKVHVGLCRRHRRKRRLGLWLGYGGFMLSVGCIIVAITVEMGEMLPAIIGPAGILGLVLFLVVGIVMSQVTRPIKITRDQVWLSVGKRFAASLPTEDEL